MQVGDFLLRHNWFYVEISVWIKKIDAYKKERKKETQLLKTKKEKQKERKKERKKEWKEQGK